MKPIGLIRFITIHASATTPSMDIGVEEVTQWHLDRGWSDIGYHWLIRRDGTWEKGRPSVYQGAHVGGFNSGNLGICMVGGLKEGTKTPENNFTDPQWVTLFERVRMLHENFPEAVIMGHNGFPGHEARGCPCFDWRDWREEFHRRIREPLHQLPSHWYEVVDKEEPDG